MADEGLTIRHPTQLACKWCFADIDEPCVGPSGTPMKGTYHAVRQAEASGVTGAQAVVCKWCNAGVAEPCTGPSGVPSGGRYHHVRRVEAAVGAKSSPAVEVIAKILRQAEARAQTKQRALAAQQAPD